jgi:hypothetical protein
VTDDIVTRLRAEVQMESVGDGTKEWQSNEICHEAAEYIEELRAELAECRDQYRRLWNKQHRQKVLAEMCDPHDPCQMCKELAGYGD